MWIKLNQHWDAVINNVHCTTGQVKLVYPVPFLEYEQGWLSFHLKESFKVVGCTVVLDLCCWLQWRNTPTVYGYSSFDIFDNITGEYWRIPTVPKFCSHLPKCWKIMAKVCEQCSQLVPGRKLMPGPGNHQVAVGSKFPIHIFFFNIEIDIYIDLSEF